MKAAIASGWFTVGSFGIYPFGDLRGNEVMRVWFCGYCLDGSPRSSHDTIGQVCAHATRQEARDCARRRKIAGHGKG